MPDVARATGADETSVRAWLRAARSPSGTYAERLAELSAIVERLVRVMDPEYVPVQMRKPVPLLDDDKPLDLIAARDYTRVSRVIAGLEPSGAVQPRLDVDSTSALGVWWRHIPAEGDVCYEPPHPADNRWQRGSVVGAWYFADSEPTVWAEWYRYLAEAALPLGADSA